MLKRWREPIPLRFVLVVPFVLITVGTSALVGYWSHRSSQQATATLANQLLQQTSERVNDRLTNYLQPSQQVVAANELSVEQGTLDLNNSEQVRQRLWEQVVNNPSLPGSGFWSEDGSGLAYLRINSAVEQQMMSQLTNRILPLGTIYYIRNQSGQQRYYLVDAQGKPETLIHQLKTDFRQSSWYQQAIAFVHGQPSWTSIFLARATPIWKMVSAASVHNEAGEPQGVFTAPYFLANFSVFLSQLPLTEDGQAFIVDRSGALVATSVSAEASVRQQTNIGFDRLPALSSRDELTRAVAKQLLARSLSFEEVSSQLFQFRFNGQQQFVRVMPYRDSDGLDWLVVTVIPESDFMTGIYDNARNTVMLCLLTLGGSIALGLAISDRVTLRIDRLKIASQKLADGDLNQQLSADSGIAELHGLARSFNQTASQLRELFEQEVEAEAIRLREALFQQLASAVPGVIYIYTEHPDGLREFEYVSSYAQTLFELEPAEILADVDRLLKQMPPDDLAAYAIVATHSSKTLEPFTTSFRQILPSGQLKWIKASARPLLKADGSVAWYGVFLDVTESKQLEEQLRRSTVHLKKAQEIARCGHWDCNFVTKQIYWSEEMYRIYDIQSGEPIPNCEDTAEWIHPDDQDKYRTEVLQKALAGKPFGADLRIVLPDGSIRHVEHRGEPVFDQHHNLISLKGTVQDVSDRKQIEMQLQQQAKNLQQALRDLQHAQLQLVQSEKMSSLGQLVAGVAHEINNPLGFISGNLTYAREYVEDLVHLLQVYELHYPQPIAAVQLAKEAIDVEALIEDFPKLLGSMQNGADRIKNIVLGLRSFSRMDESDKKIVDLHDGINSTLLILQSRLKPAGRQHAIDVIQDYGELPRMECYAGQLNQVFMNLIANAIDALSDRRQSEDAIAQILIRTRHSGDRVAIEVADNGTGILPHVLPQIFDPFFTTKPIGEGTGLGLAISYQIAEKHQGQLTCTSQPGQGTTFRLELPIANAKSLSHSIAKLTQSQDLRRSDLRLEQ